MQFGVHLPNFGDFAQPRLRMELAYEAEAAGWDDFFLWDHIQWTLPQAEPLVDPWIALAAVAATTTRIKLGPLVTPLPRRRPWKLAREAVSLDHLSNGRLVLGVGIGGDWCQEFSAFGEPAEDKRHAEMLDEGLEVLARLWSGEPLSHHGQHYHLTDVRFLPQPAQTPRIPVWVAGVWPRHRPFRRAAAWDGVVPLGRDGAMTPDDYRALLQFVAGHRQSTTPFDVACGGSTPGIDRAADGAIVASFAEAGVTWWLENTTEERDALEAMRTRIRRGPPVI